MGGLLFIADWGNHAIRVRDGSGGGVSTIAGSTTGQAGDAVPTVFGNAARFRFPNGLAYRASDKTLFVIDGNNCVVGSVIVSSTGVAVQVVAGTIGNGSSGVSDQCGDLDAQDPLTARIKTFSPGGPSPIVRALGMAITSSGDVMFAQTLDGARPLRSLSVDGVQSFGGLDDAPLDGPLSEAGFRSVAGLALLPTGAVLAADRFNHLIRRIDLAAKLVSTEAGQRADSSRDLDGDVGTARFNGAPQGLHMRPDGSILVASSTRIREVSPSAQVSTVADPLAEPTRSVAEALNGLLYRTSGSQLHGQRGGAIEFSLRNGVPVDGGANDAQMGCPRAMAVDSQGRAVVADACAFAVRRVTQQGVVSRIAGNYSKQGSDFGDALDVATFGAPIDVAVAANDDIYVLDAGNRSISKIAPVNGRNVVSPVLANLDDPRALAIDEVGNLYVAEGALNVIKRIRPNGEASVIAGQPSVRGYAPGSLPGVLSIAQDVSLKVHNNRLVMTMEKGVVEISPLPQ